MDEYEVRLRDDHKTVDEFLSDHVKSIHFEDMGNHFWCGIYLNNGKRIVLNFSVSDGKFDRSRVNMTVEEDEIGGKSWGYD